MALSSETLLEQLQNPTNVILLVVVLYLAYPLFVTTALPSSTSPLPAKAATSHLDAYSWLPAEHPESIVWKQYTPRSLRPFDGTRTATAPILFAIRGKVYDVSNGRNFYGPGGPYGNFAGRDASRGLAKNSFDEDVLTPIDAPIDDLADLTSAEWDSLKEWEIHFKTKYFQCGDFGPEE